MDIIVALDESPEANTMIQWMKAFPHPADTRMSLVHVLEPLDVPNTIGAERWNALRLRRQADAQARLSRVARALRPSYPETDVLVREGFPTYELLNVIRDVHPDLMVVGTRRLQGAQGLVLGSVSQRLLSYASCSVLLIPPLAKPAERMRAMFATDGSKGAKLATRFLVHLPDLKEIFLVTAVQPIDRLQLGLRKMSQAKFSTLRDQLMAERRAVAERAINETARALKGTGVAIKTRIAVGRASEVIPKLAQRERSDLLVLGSRGLSGLAAMAVGSLSLTMAQRAICPLLVVKRS